MDNSPFAPKIHHLYLVLGIPSQPCLTTNFIGYSCGRPIVMKTIPGKPTVTGVIIHHPISRVYPLVNVYIAIEHGPVEIVSFPMKNMVDLSSSQTVSSFTRPGISININLHRGWFVTWGLARTLYPYYIQWIGLRKKYRKPLYLMGTSMVSCRFSLKPIHMRYPYRF